MDTTETITKEGEDVAEVKPTFSEAIKRGLAMPDFVEDKSSWLLERHDGSGKFEGCVVGAAAHAVGITPDQLNSHMGSWGDLDRYLNEYLSTDTSKTVAELGIKPSATIVRKYGPVSDRTLPIYVSYWHQTGMSALRIANSLQKKGL